MSSELIDAKIAGLGDWRGATLTKLRALIHAADPEVEEAVKWQKPSNPSGVPVWEHAGILCTGETYKDKVKLTFAKGAALADPKRLFNSSLDGNTRRAIDLFEGDRVDQAAFRALVPARSVPCSNSTSYASAETIFFHSAALFLRGNGAAASAAAGKAAPASQPLRVFNRARLFIVRSLVGSRHVGYRRCVAWTHRKSVLSKMSRSAKNILTVRRRSDAHHTM